MRVSFIGLGAMGFPMAGHLAKNFDLTVWNRTGSVAQEHARTFGSGAASKLADCGDADAIITILPTSREVDEIIDELAPKLKSGALWIDSTSGDPLQSRQSAKRLNDRGVRFVDAPVTGGTPGAEKGTLTVMIGGSESDFRRAQDIVKPFSAKIFHCGGVGMGHAIKVITNTMNAANIWVAGEGLLALKKLGMDMKLALEVINAGSGRSNATENLVPKRVVDGQWPLTFKLSLHDKDIRIANSLAHSQHLVSPVFGLVGQFFTAACNELGHQADYMDVLKYAARMNGEEW